MNPVVSRGSTPIADAGEQRLSSGFELRLEEWVKIRAADMALLILFLLFPVCTHCLWPADVD